MRESKECLECGGIYFRPEWEKHDKRWGERKYCSVQCAGIAGRRVANSKKALASHAEALEIGQADGIITIDEGIDEAVAEISSELKQSPPERFKEPVMRELRIVRVGPNPRLVVCEYMELAERRVCTVLVKRTSKFVKGMRLVMTEPREEGAYVRPWVYEGRLPRHRGRW